MPPPAPQMQLHWCKFYSDSMPNAQAPLAEHSETLRKVFSLIHSDFACGTVLDVKPPTSDHTQHSVTNSSRGVVFEKARSQITIQKQSWALSSFFSVRQTANLTITLKIRGLDDLNNGKKKEKSLRSNIINTYNTITTAGLASQWASWWQLLKQLRQWKTFLDSSPDF